MLPDVLAVISGVLPVYPDKFIIFNYDIGGFNNIRISFEVIIILAKLLGRVLIVPPKTNMYLLDKNTDIFDYYSINNLSHYIKICNYQDITKNIKTANDLFLFAKKSKEDVRGSSDTRRVHPR